MKSTDQFKKTIEEYLKNRAKEDSLFRDKFCNPEKNINDCITYILNTVQKSGCSGFADDEIYSMAIHYYDEDKIEIGKPISAKVIVNHSAVPSQKEETKKNASEDITIEPIIRPSNKKSKQPELTLSLF